MALPIDQFYTPEQDFRGLTRLGETMERKNYRDEQMRLREEGRKESAEAKRAASSRFFANYLDPNDKYTGTKFDPKVYELLNEAKAQAYELAKKGANDTDILSAINPIVNNVDKYVQTAKVLNEQKKQAIQILKEQKGIDPIRFSKEFDNEVFTEVDPKTGAVKERDLSMIDPNTNYADLVLKNRDVYTPEGFEDFVAKSGKETMVEDVSVYDRNKAMRRTKAEITKPSFMVSEKDQRGVHLGFVPEYEIASDGDQPLMHDFMTAEGVKETAPVRMVTPEIFRSLPASAQAYLRQEARRYAKQKNIDLSDPRVENFARALAYDELKTSAKKYSTLKELKIEKAAPIRNITNINMPGSGINFRDSYRRILAESNNPNRPNKSVPINELNSEDADVVISAAQRKDPSADYSNIFVKQDNDGVLRIYKAEDGSLVTSLTEGGVNVDANKPFGIKAKTAAESAAKTESPKPTQSKMVTVVLSDGRKGQIPSNKVAQFLKDNPGSKQQ